MADTVTPLPERTTLFAFVLGRNAIWLAMVTGLMLTIATFWVVHRQLDLQQQLDFKWAADNRFRALQREVDANLKAVRDLGDILARSDTIDRRSFQPAAQALLAELSGVDVLAWAPRLAGEAPGAAREVPVRLQEPTQATPSLVGLDLAVAPGFRELLSQAEKNGALTAGRAPPTLWGAEKTDGVRFAAVFPVSTEGVSAGFVAAILNVERLVEASIGHLEPRGIDYWIYAIGDQAAKRPLHAYTSRLRPDGSPSPASPPAPGEAHAMTGTLTVGNLGWRFNAAAAPHFRSAQAFHEGPWIILVEGVLFTLAFTLYFLEVNRDMARRAAMDRALREKEERLRSLFEHSPDVILTLDSAGNVLFMNRPYAGFDPEKQEGEPFLSFLPEVQRDRHARALARVLSEKRVQRLVYALPDYTWWETRLIPLALEGEADATLVILTDVTENRVLQAQAVRNARLASLGVLAASVAHEINNPNSAIQFNASILLRSWGDLLPMVERQKYRDGSFSLGGMPVGEAVETIPRLLKGMVKSSQQIKKIVDNLKFMARQDKGELNQKAQVRDILQSAFSILQNQIRKKCDNCRMDVPSDLPELRGNPQQLEQVVINLMMNALESLPDRTAGVFITASMDEDEDWLVIRVEDEGTGIPEERMALITDPFFTTKEESGGTGLGLSISAGIIKAHGGRLEFQSRPGNGTVALIKLPLLPSTLDGLHS